MSSSAKKSPSPAAKRVAAYRKRMRDAGYVPRTLWTRDTNEPGFIAEYERQCRAIAANATEADVLDWVEAMQADLDLGGIPEYCLPRDE